MKITIDTDRNIFIVPNSFYKTIDKHNEVLRKAGVSEDKLITKRKLIEDAIAEAFKRPILTVDQAKDYNEDFENQMAEEVITKEAEK